MNKIAAIKQKERARLTEVRMARNTYQQGCIAWRKREDGSEVPVLRYRERDLTAPSGWKEHTEVLRGWSTKKELSGTRRPKDEGNQ